MNPSRDNFFNRTRSESGEVSRFDKILDSVQIPKTMRHHDIR